MAGKGGRRPGAGRPRKEDAKRRQPGPVRLADEAFRDALPALAKVALELAIKGKDAKMIQYCINRALGMPTQPVDMLDAVRQMAVARNLDPDRVINLYEAVKRRRAAS